MVCLHLHWINVLQKLPCALLIGKGLPLHQVVSDDLYKQTSALTTCIRTYITTTHCIRSYMYVVARGQVEVMGQEEVRGQVEVRGQSSNSWVWIRISYSILGNTTSYLSWYFFTRGGWVCKCTQHTLPLPTSPLDSSCVAMSRTRSATVKSGLKGSSSI